MYIIETTFGPVHIDTDELVRLKEEQGSKLIFFRQGAVNPEKIVRVVADTERKSNFLKMVNETEEEFEDRVNADISEDIFSTLRKNETPTLAAGMKNLRLKP